MKNSIITKVSGVHYSYDGGTEVLEDIGFTIRRGEFLGVIGPNGAGKTTLLRLLAGGLKPAKGSVKLFDREISTYSRKELARRIAVVSQEQSWTFEFTVNEYILLGRYPFIGSWALPSSADMEIVEDVLDRVNALDLRNRFITELSGGEKQRVMLARAIAQSPELLLLDEPGAHLDINHRMHLLRLLKSMNENLMTIVMISHDLNIAAMFCSNLMFLKQGRLLVEGSPGEVFNGRNLKELFETDLLVKPDPSGNPHFFPVKENSS